MTQHDVFNGDADGICALHQLRLAMPRESVLVTGAKRDIALLARVDAASGDHVTALDISLAVNRRDVLRLLQAGATIEYFDHHQAGEIPAHPNLQATIDTSADVCTSMLVDRYLGGAYRPWAVVAAYGDDLLASAEQLADVLRLDTDARAALRALGDVLAYNAYGDSVDDLIAHPAALYRALHGYEDPFAFIGEEPLWREIAARRDEDLRLAHDTEPTFAARGALVYVLPDAPWSRRVRGSYGNALANRDPHLAHAILNGSPARGYMVSVRAPLLRRAGADVLCGAFAGGGGRAGAAGINHLPHDRLDDFVRALDRAYPGE